MCKDYPDVVRRENCQKFDSSLYCHSRLSRLFSLITRFVHVCGYIFVNGVCDVCCCITEQQATAHSRPVLELSDGFHLSDAMHFCRRGMEVTFSSLSTTISVLFD